MSNLKLFRKPVDEAPRPAPAPEALAEVAREVAEDARRKPAEYLKDTEVPAGGE